MDERNPFARRKETMVEIITFVGIYRGHIPNPGYLTWCNMDSVRPQNEARPGLYILQIFDLAVRQTAKQAEVPVDGQIHVNMLFTSC